MTDPWNVNKEEHNSAASFNYGFSPVPPELTPPKHAGLGIASFIIGLVSLLLCIISMVVAASSIMDYIGDDSNLYVSPEDLLATVGMGFIVAGLLILGSFVLSVIGLILGIVAVCLKNRRKVFSILGIVFSALLPVGFGCLILLGLVAEASQ